MVISNNMLISASTCRVDGAFRDALDSSTKIQRKLFVKPDEQRKKNRINPFLYRIIGKYLENATIRVSRPPSARDVVLELGEEPDGAESESSDMEELHTVRIVRAIDWLPKGPIRVTIDAQSWKKGVTFPEKAAWKQMLAAEIRIKCTFNYNGEGYDVWRTRSYSAKTLGEVMEVAWQLHL